MTSRPQARGARGRRRQPLGRPRPILLALLLAPASLLLGFLGYRSADIGLSTSDAFSASLQLFTVGGVIPADSTPWQLEVARLLAPVAVVYAAVVTALGLLRQYAERLVVALTAKDHVVVVGLGATGAEVAKGLRRGGHQVVALELDPRNPRILAARAEGVKVVIGDGTSRHFLDRARVRRAHHVVVMTGNDSLNLEIASAVRELVAGLTVRRVRLHVAVGHVELWRELSRTALTAPAGTSTEYVHLADRTAQRLLGEATRSTGSLPASLLVTGCTPVAGRLITLILQRDTDREQPTKILLAAGSPLLGLLERDDPWCLASGRVQEMDDVDAPDLIVVCDEEAADARAISQGLLLARQHPAAVVMVAVYRPRSERTLTAAGVTEDRVLLVSAKVDALGQELFDTSATEIMARARHGAYLATETSLGHDVASNPSLLQWDDLPDSLKESNRRFADSVSKIIGRLGAQLAPLTGSVTDLELPLSADLLDALAREEHERWMSAIEDQGWRPTAGVKDPVEKLHPLLVPWESLPEAERQKDRDAFQALPRMLAMIGYRLVLPARTA